MIFLVEECEKVLEPKDCTTIYLDEQKCVCVVKKIK